MKAHNENALFISVSVCMTMVQCIIEVYSEKKKKIKHIRSCSLLDWICFSF